MICGQTQLIWTYFNWFVVYYVQTGLGCFYFLLLKEWCLIQQVLQNWSQIVRTSLHGRRLHVHFLCPCEYKRKTLVCANLSHVRVTTLNAKNVALAARILDCQACSPVQASAQRLPQQLPGVGVAEANRKGCRQMLCQPCFSVQINFSEIIDDLPWSPNNPMPRPARFILWGLPPIVRWPKILSFWRSCQGLASHEDRSETMLGVASRLGFKSGLMFSKSLKDFYSTLSNCRCI